MVLESAVMYDMGFSKVVLCSSLDNRSSLVSQRIEITSRTSHEQLFSNLQAIYSRYDYKCLVKCPNISLTHQKSLKLRMLSLQTRVYSFACDL